MAQPSKILKIFWTWLSAKFSFAFCVFINSSDFENSHFLARIYFILLKKRPRPNLKDFQYQIWASVKRSGKWSSSKRNFSEKLKEKSKSCQRPCQVAKFIKKIKFEGVSGDLEARNRFQWQNIKIFETNSSFHVK